MKTIKLYDGIKIITSREIRNVKYIPDVWDAFGWDIHNDKIANECSLEITKQLICFGRVDLSQFTTDGSTLILEVIPVSEEEQEAM